MVDDYVNILENYLGVKRTTFSFVERWSQCPPEEAGGKPLKEFLSKVSFLEILNTQIYSAAEWILPFFLRWISRVRRFPKRLPPGLW